MAEPQPSSLPVIVEPFSRLGDEIAGDSASEIALNLAAATRLSLIFHKRPLRPCVSPWATFAQCKSELSAAAIEALKYTARAYEPFLKQREVAQPGRAPDTGPRSAALGGGAGGLNRLDAGSNPALPTLETLF